MIQGQRVVALQEERAGQFKADAGKIGALDEDRAENRDGLAELALLNMGHALAELCTGGLGVRA